MKTKLSLAVACVLLCGSSLMAEDNTSVSTPTSSLSIFSDIDKALSESLVSGEFLLHTQYADKAYEGNNGFDSDKGSGFLSGSFNILFSTGKLYDFNINMGARGSHALLQKEDGYGYNKHDHDTAILHTANLAYYNKYVDVVFGRQKLDLAWINSYNEALVGTTKIIPGAVISVGYTNRYSYTDDDKPILAFTRIDQEGMFFIDGTYTGILDGLSINPYIYYRNDLSAWVGVRGDYDTKIGAGSKDIKVGGTVHVVHSKEEEDYVDDASLLHLEGRGSFYGVDATLGVINTWASVSNIRETGEHISPFAYGGCQLFSYDALSVYTSANYAWQDIRFRGVYSYTKGDENFAVHQLELSANYPVAKHLDAKAYITHAQGDIDYDQILLGALYSF